MHQPTQYAKEPLKMIKRLAHTFKIRELAKIIAGSSDTFEYTIKEMNDIHKANSLMVSMGFGKFLDNEFRSKKKSDTIFILGSGPSINDLTPNDFRHIEKHDSIGFNFWLAHNFVPTYYCFQHVKFGSEGIYKLLREKQCDYKDVPMIVRGSLLSVDPKFCYKMHKKYLSQNRVFFLNEYPVHSKFSGDIHDLIEYVVNLELLQFGRISKFTPKMRGTLTMLICLAYQMGYKNIVLCGVDMTDSTHFFDSIQYKEIHHMFSLPSPGTSNILKMQDKSFSKNIVSDYISGLCEFMNKTGQSKLFTFNCQNALSEIIPHWSR